MISGEMLDAIGTDAFPPYARLDTSGCTPPPWRATYTGAVLHIHGVNQQVVYRITEFVPSVYGYIAEWPD